MNAKEQKATKEASLREISKINGASVAQCRLDFKFTCDDCRSRGVCRWAYDMYNVNGDCLAIK